MDNTGLQLGCATDDMKMIHTVFRREFGLAPRMVRAVKPGDTAQSVRVATYLTEIVTALHHHHHGEDVILWDTLVERSPACALHVGLMKQHHEQIAALLEQVDGLSRAWTADAGEGAAERLAELLDEVSTSLNAHLGEEEEVILPIAATSMTQTEWNALGDAGRASIDKKRLLVQLGYMLEDATPEQRVDMMAHVPAPARLLYRLIGRRQYEKEIATLRPPVDA